MEKHISDQELYGYLSNNSSVESNIKVSRHIAGCTECFERIKAVMYLKENFNEEWEELSLSSIAKLNKELKSIEKEQRIQKNKIIFFEKHWIKMLAIASLFIIVIGLAEYQSTENKSNKYDKWKQVGVINSTKSLDNKVNSKEFRNMVTTLAGTKDIDMTRSEYHKDKLKVSDATDAISHTFSLSYDDKKKMLKDMNLNSELTCKRVLDIFDCFSGEIYSSNMNGKNIKGNLAIRLSGKTIKNISVSGNLYIMQGVGNGEVVLSNVNVTGSVYVLGGGESTIILEKSNISNMTVNKANGKIRVLSREGTRIQTVKLESGAKLENDNASSDSFGKITVSSELPANSEVKLNGNFSLINVDAAQIKVIVEKGIIKELYLSKSAEKTEIILLGDSIIEKMNVDTSTLIKGTGSIDTVNINVKNVVLSVKSKITNIPENVKATDTIQEVTNKNLEQTIPEEVKNANLEQVLPSEIKGTEVEKQIPKEVRDTTIEQLIPKEVRDTTIEQLIQDEVKDTNLNRIIDKEVKKH